MKLILIIVFIITALLLIAQIYLTMISNKAAAKLYKVVLHEKNFEIRFYPSFTIASINSSAKNYKELSNSGFRKLAGYIFGGNESNQKISMTSPVQMDINDSMSSMSFIMPSMYNAVNLPKPNDKDVHITNTTDEYVAVINFDGFASDEKIKRYSEILDHELKACAITSYGNFRLLGYNPPYQLFGRKNEIIVSVQWNTK